MTADVPQSPAVDASEKLGPIQSEILKVLHGGERVIRPFGRMCWTQLRLQSGERRWTSASVKKLLARGMVEYSGNRHAEIVLTDAGKAAIK